MIEDPAESLIVALMRTIAEHPVEADEDILNAVANLLVNLAKAAEVQPRFFLENIGRLMGATNVHVQVVPVGKGKGGES